MLANQRNRQRGEKSSNELCRRPQTATAIKELLRAAVAADAVVVPCEARARLLLTFFE